jgi:hypothetical protein
MVFSSLSLANKVNYSSLSIKFSTIAGFLFNTGEIPINYRDKK